jgi:hypothetical protein
MKKIIIITAIMLLAVSGFAQPNTRERKQHMAEENNKEVIARRTVQNHKSNGTARPEVHKHSMESTQTRSVQTYRNETNARRSNPKASQNSARTGNKTISTKRNTPKVQNHTGNKPHSGKNNMQGTVRTTERNHYTTPNRQHVRKNHVATAHHNPVRYNAKQYRVPKHANVNWSPQLYREYRSLYPDFHYWHYTPGYSIVTVPAYRAYFHIGELRNVYGRISDIWHSWETDEYNMYFGGTYPYHDFTVILSGKYARQFHSHPEVFFSGRYIWVTGLVSTFWGKPEIMVMRKHQVHLY